MQSGELSFSDSVVVDCCAEALYDIVSDVTRVREWSPVCKACWWDPGASARVGAWFTGRNELPQRTWETRSQVVAADRGSEFAWEVGDSFVRWGYALDPLGPARTRLTESWDFLPAGIASFHERFGPDAEAQIVDRTELARRGIPETLAAIKRIAEGAGHERWSPGGTARQPTLDKSSAGPAIHPPGGRLDMLRETARQHSIPASTLIESRRVV